MIGFNSAVFRRQITPQMRRFAEPVMKRRVEKFVEKTKEEALQQFEDNAVTQELDRGAQARGSSFLQNGNLTAFLGYDKNEIQPTDVIRYAMEDGIKIRTFHQSRIKSDGSYEVKASVQIPTIKSIDESTPLPWFPQKGIVSSIERGVSGFMRTIFGDFDDNSASLSGGGLQAKNNVRGSDFRGVGRNNFLSKIFRDFKNKIRAKNK